MRTSAIIAALAAAAALAGCAGRTIVERDGVRFRCNTRNVNVINVEGQPLRVRRDPVNVCRGYSFALNFRNPVAPGNARTRAAGQEQPGRAEWLNVQNTSPRQIIVTVPDDAQPGEYKYDVEIAGWPVLDPVARVE